MKIQNINDNLVFYRSNKSNINNPVRSFFLTIATLTVSKAYRDNLLVNENFFKLLKFNNKFRKEYKEYLDSYFYSSLAQKTIFFIKSLFFFKEYFKEINFKQIKLLYGS